MADRDAIRQRRRERAARAREQRQESDQHEHPDTTYTLEPLAEASAEDWLGTNTDPDVLLSVPNLGVDHIGLEVDNLRAHVELHAKVLDLLELHVGADVAIDKVELDIDNVRVQAMLKVRLEEVTKIVDRVMQTIDNNPQILTELTRGVGHGVEKALSSGDGDSGGVSGELDTGTVGDGSDMGGSNVPEPEKPKSEGESGEEDAAR